MPCSSFCHREPPLKILPMPLASGPQMRPTMLDLEKTMAVCRVLYIVCSYWGVHRKYLECTNVLFLWHTSSQASFFNYYSCHFFGSNRLAMHKSVWRSTFFLLMWVLLKIVYIASLRRAILCRMCWHLNDIDSMKYTEVTNLKMCRLLSLNRPYKRLLY